MYLSKKIKHLIARVHILCHQKTFEKNGRRIKYLYEPGQNNNVLVVIFSAFPAINGKSSGGYNMVSTLHGIRCSRLFILDRFGYNGVGTYYLGEKGEFNVYELASALIKKFSEGRTKTIFLGSSKGGTAAIYYGICLKADIVIAGAPQYYIGEYLTSKPEHIPIMDGIAGNHEKETVEYYNHIVPDMVNREKSNGHTKIYIHYSPNEPTYHLHIKYLLEDLKNNGYSVMEDVESYTEHNDVARYFPEWCRKEILEIIEEG